MSIINLLFNKYKRTYLYFIPNSLLNSEDAKEVLPFYNLEKECFSLCVNIDCDAEMDQNLSILSPLKGTIAKIFPNQNAVVINANYDVKILIYFELQNGLEINLCKQVYESIKQGEKMFNITLKNTDLDYKLRYHLLVLPESGNAIINKLDSDKYDYQSPIYEIVPKN